MIKKRKIKDEKGKTTSQKVKVGTDYFLMLRCTFSF